MRRALLLTAALLLVALVAPARAQGFRVASFGTFTANVTLTTTTEAVVITSDVVQSPRDEREIVVLAWAQLTTGAATTTVTPRIRRGDAITSTLVGEANAVTIGAAAGSTEQFQALAVERLAGGGAVQYSFTLQQASATGNGTALQGSILVLVR